MALETYHEMASTGAIQWKYDWSSLASKHINATARAHTFSRVDGRAVILHLKMPKSEQATVAYKIKQFTPAKNGNPNVFFGRHLQLSRLPCAQVRLGGADVVRDLVQSGMVGICWNQDI